MVRLKSPQCLAHARIRCNRQTSIIGVRMDGVRDREAIHDNVPEDSNGCSSYGKLSEKHPHYPPYKEPVIGNGHCMRFSVPTRQWDYPL